MGRIILNQIIAIKTERLGALECVKVCLLYIYLEEKKTLLSFDGFRKVLVLLFSINKTNLLNHISKYVYYGCCNTLLMVSLQ